jgi:hypothetical protein
VTFETTMGSLRAGGRHEVSEETRAAHEAAMKRAEAAGMDRETEAVLINGELRAKWKIEVTFMRNRTPKGLNAYGVRIWESGRALNGEGDVLAFWCLNADPDSNEGCRNIISSDFIKEGVAFCPHCKRTIRADMLTDMVGGNVYMDSLAKYLAGLFRKLNSSADIYLKFHREDIRYVAMVRAKGGEKAEKMKGLHIYPLKNIIKDTSAGADLGKRILAFLSA